MSHARSVLVLLLLAACSEPDGPGTDLGIRDALGDPCAPYGASLGEVCASALSYTAGPALPGARDHHGTAIAETGQGAYLYVSGGTSYSNIFSDVQVAAIAPDGGLGPFSETTRLPGPRAGHGVFVHAGRLFVVGGRSGLNFLGSTASAPINEDGSLGAWVDEPALPTVQFHLAAVATATHAYAVGGVSGSTAALPYVATSVVYAAPFLADGHLGPWQALDPLPEARSHLAVVAAGDRLYLVGGILKDTSPLGANAHTILSARVQAGGALGPFTVAGELPLGLATLAAFAAGGNLYAVGGLDDDDGYSAGVYAAPLREDGTLGSISAATPLPVGRSHVHHTPYHAGHLYSAGGSVDLEVVTDEVWIGAFSPGQALSARRPLDGVATRRGKKGCACGRRISIPR